MLYDYLFKIIFIGDSNVGKTAIANRLAQDRFDCHYQATIGVDFYSITLDIDDNRIKTHIWDTAGQECFSSIITTYYRGVAGAVLVFDVGRESSFHKCHYWLNQVVQKGSEKHKPFLLLIGNKCDRKNRVVSREDAERFAKDHNMLYFETSAKKDTNIHESYCYKS